MGMKTVDFNDYLANIIQQYPELLDILYDLGFTQIKAPGMLQTAGKFMSLKMGCDLRKIDINALENYLIALGYTVND